MTLLPVANLGLNIIDLGMWIADRGLDALVSKTGVRKSALFVTNVGWRIGEFGTRLTDWAVDDAELSARIETMRSRFAVQRRRLANLVSRAVLCVALLFSVYTVGGGGGGCL
jgi:hypothetical protein